MSNQSFAPNPDEEQRKFFGVYLLDRCILRHSSYVHIHYHRASRLSGRMAVDIAIIGSGPTGIYTLKGLVGAKRPLSVTVFEVEADAGKGTPYHPDINDQAMLANIASIELPPICETLVRVVTPPAGYGVGAPPGPAVRILGRENFTPESSSASFCSRSSYTSLK